jgi:hypothetical protein
MLKRIKNLAGGTSVRLILILTFWLMPAEAQPPGEYMVKAAFVYNFLKYVEWPDAAGCRAADGFKLGIVGRNPFEDAFDKFKGKPVGNCTLEVSAVSPRQPLDPFAAVFISSSEKAGLQGMVSPIKSLPVLTIGDSPGFMQEGVMINLIQRDDKLGFEINLKAARVAGLRISSQLLKLANAIQE